MSPTQAERRAATRAALVAAGRALFAQHGFGGTSPDATMALIGERLAGAEDPFALLAAGLDTLLDRCGDAEFARIALGEAPAALGRREWREIDLRHGLGSSPPAVDAGAMAPQPVVPLGHLLVSAYGEAGLLIAAGQATRDEVRGPLLALLEGLRA